MDRATTGPSQLETAGFREFLTLLHGLLNESLTAVGHSAAASPTEARCSGDPLARILASLRDALERRPAAATVGAIERPDAEPFASALGALRSALSRQFHETLGSARIERLKALLALEVPAVLSVLDKSRDENAHSDVIRWLLDPATAPTVAPAALLALVENLNERDEWRRLITEAVAAGCVSVRREVVLGTQGSTWDDLDRIDLLVTGPSFVIAIENKVGSAERDGQTTDYWLWLESRSPLRVAAFFLTPLGLAPQCLDFRPLSYFDLLRCLLEVRDADALQPDERLVLASYLKTVSSDVLYLDLKPWTALRPGGS